MQYSKGFTRIASIRLECTLELYFAYWENVNSIQKLILQMKKEELLAENA